MAHGSYSGAARGKAIQSSYYACLKKSGSRNTHGSKTQNNICRHPRLRRQRCGGEGGGAGKYYFESLSHECSAIPIFLNTRNNSTVSPCRAPLQNNCHAPSGHSGADAFPCTISQRQAVFAVLS